MSGIQVCPHGVTFQQERDDLVQMHQTVTGGPECYKDIESRVGVGTDVSGPGSHAVTLA